MPEGLRGPLQDSHRRRARDDGVDDGVREGEVLCVVVAEGDIVGTNGHGEVKANEKTDANGDDDGGGDSIVILEAGLHVKVKFHVGLVEELIADVVANHEGDKGHENGESKRYGQLCKGVGGKDLDEPGITPEDAKEAGEGGDRTNVRECKEERHERVRVCTRGGNGARNGGIVYVRDRAKNGENEGSDSQVDAEATLGKHDIGVKMWREEWGVL